MIRLLPVLTIALLYSAAAAHAADRPGPGATAEAIAAYCKVVGNSAPSGEGNDYPGTTNVVWRCADNEVYICGLGATGRQCGKLNTSVVPNDPIRNYCRKNPNASIVPMVVAGGYAATWKCQGSNPTITGASAVDEQGYVTSAWSKVSASSPPDTEVRAFVEEIYSRSETVAHWRSVFDPDTLALLATNRKLLNGDLGALDYNPLCHCQDAGGMKASIKSLKLTGLESAIADVDLRFPGGSEDTVKLFLLKGREGWKLRNIASKNGPSLWDMIITENKRLSAAAPTTNAKPAAQACFMGECFKKYIVSKTEKSAGIIAARVRTENYYEAPAHGQPKAPTLEMVEASCQQGNGYIQYPGLKKLREPEPNSPHATQAEKQLWTAICDEPAPPEPTPMAQAGQAPSLTSCVNELIPVYCRQSASIDSVTKVDQMEEKNKVTMLADVEFTVRKPFRGTCDMFSTLSNSCTGVCWDMDPRKVRSSDGRLFVVGQRLKVRASISFQKWQSGRLQCMQQLFHGTQGWYLH